MQSLLDMYLLHFQEKLLWYSLNTNQLMGSFSIIFRSGRKRIRVVDLARRKYFRRKEKKKICGDFSG
jgi:hypothetical protein